MDIQTREDLLDFAVAFSLSEYVQQREFVKIFENFLDNDLNASIVIELLWDCLILQKNVPHAMNLINLITNSNIKNSQIHILAAFHFRQINRFSDCATSLSKVSDIATWSRSKYEPYLSDCTTYVITNYLKVMEGALSDDRRQAFNQRIIALYSEVLALHLRCSQNATAAHFKIWEAGFVNRLGIRGHEIVIQNAIKSISLVDDVEMFSQCFAYFVAIGRHDVAEGMVISGLAHKLISLNPHFLKTVCRYAHLSNQHHYEAIALEQAITKDLRQEEWTYYLNEALIYELEMRAAHVNLSIFPPNSWPFMLRKRCDIISSCPGWICDELPRQPVGKNESRKSNIFVGLFGQLRDPNVTLPAIYDYMIRDFARHSNIKLNFGVATWEQTSISDSHLGVFLGILPDVVTTVVVEEGIQSISDLQNFFPNTFCKVLGLSGLASIDINEQTNSIKQHFHGNVVVDVESDEPITDWLTKLQLRDGFIGSGQHRNQFKMWNRIGALGKIIEAIEYEDAVPFDFIILARVDLMFLSGSLADLMTQCSHLPNERIVFCDHDRQTLFVEGLGDRFFVSSREGMRPLLGGFAKLEKMFADENGAPLSFKHRVAGHQFVDSILFTSGFNAIQIPKSEIDWRIHRPKQTLDSLMKSLCEDAIVSPSEKIRERIKAIIA